MTELEKTLLENHFNKEIDLAINVDWVDVDEDTILTLYDQEARADVIAQIKAHFDFNEADETELAEYFDDYLTDDLWHVDSVSQAFDGQYELDGYYVQVFNFKGKTIVLHGEANGVWYYAEELVKGSSIEELNHIIELKNKIVEAFENTTEKGDWTIIERKGGNIKVPTVAVSSVQALRAIRKEHQWDSDFNFVFASYPYITVE